MNAGVIQWQNGSFPSCIWRFDSAHPLKKKKEGSLPAGRQEFPSPALLEAVVRG